MTNLNPLDPNDNHISTARKAPPSQAEEVRDSQEANVTANFTSQEVASTIREGATTILEMHISELVVPVGHLTMATLKPQAEL